MTTAYRCNGCNRSFSRKLEQVAELLAKGNARCKFCGSGDLEFPEQVHAYLASSAGVAVDWDPDQPTAYSCGGCSRSYTRPLGRVIELASSGRTNCQLCGAGLEFPPEVHQAILDLQSKGVLAEETHVDCLLCGRPNPFDDRARELAIKCAVCGTPFLPPAALGESSRPPPSRWKPVDASTIAPGGKWLNQVFRARAERGELGAGEAERITAALRAIWRWNPVPSELELPLSLELVAPVIASLLFPGLPYTSDQDDYGVELVFVISSSGSSKAMGNLGGTLLYNLAGTLSLFTIGIGRFKRGDTDGDSSGQDQQRLRLGVYPAKSGGGVVLGLQAQSNADTPTPAPADALQQLGEALVATKPAIEAYLSLLAIFGPSVEGASAFSATPKGINARLTDLGPILNRPAADLLCPGRVGQKG
ncbi:MAG: hypothetical protein JKY65_31355 [Planctomycetes bacterium]|nr:hypothetical protein [Planctomycetota bacterium]